MQVFNQGSLFIDFPVQKASGQGKLSVSQWVYYFNPLHFPMPELHDSCTWIHFTANCLSAMFAHVSNVKCVRPCFVRAGVFHIIIYECEILWLTFIYVYIFFFLGNCLRCVRVTSYKCKGFSYTWKSSSSFTTASLRANSEESAVKL